MKKVLITLVAFVTLSLLGESASAIQTRYGQPNITPIFGNVGWKISCGLTSVYICYTKDGNTIWCGGYEYILISEVNSGHPDPADPTKNVGSIINVQDVTP